MTKKTQRLQERKSISQTTELAVLPWRLDGRSLHQHQAYRALVFQAYNLIPYLTALQNVTLAMDIVKPKEPDKKGRASYLLKQVGLTETEIRRNVLRLSGGQQQRVAIARTLACEVDLILADEPTGNLDQTRAEGIVSIFRQLAHNE